MHVGVQLLSIDRMHSTDERAPIVKRGFAKFFLGEFFLLSTADMCLHASLKLLPKARKSGSRAEESGSRGTNAKISRQGRTDRQALVKSSHDQELRVLSLLLAFVLSLDKAIGGGVGWGGRKSAGTFSPHPLGQ